MISRIKMESFLEDWLRFEGFVIFLIHQCVFAASFFLICVVLRLVIPKQFQFVYLIVEHCYFLTELQNSEWLSYDFSLLR